MPDRYLKGDGLGGATIKELQTYFTVPNHGDTSCWQVDHHEATMPTKIYLLPNSRFPCINYILARHKLYRARRLGVLHS